MRLRLGIVFALLGLALPARADEDVPPLPAPFVLPELTHPVHRVSVDGFLGGVGGAAAAIVRPALEATVFIPRRIFVGVAYPLAIGRPPDLADGSRTLPGNLESHVRAVFMLPSAFEIGFSLGAIAPTATFERTPVNRSIAAAAASLDPTNYAHFLPQRTALRPAGDLRIRRGPFVIQARHGIDILIDGAAIDLASASGRLLVHAGWLVTERLEVSLEFAQNYQFASTVRSTDAFDEKYRIRDGRRSSMTIGPALRYATPELDIGAALVTNIGDAASPAASEIIGLRVSAAVHFAK